jgi:hypothetical protein
MQGFFSTVIPWAILVWAFFRQHVYYPGDVYLLGGDEVVTTKAGQASGTAGTTTPSIWRDHATYT